MQTCAACNPNMKTASAIILAIASTLTACDAAVADQCIITPVGVQAISEDMDMDGAPDHAPFMVAGLSGTCPKDTIDAVPVALYEEGSSVVMHGFGGLTMLGKSCAMWTWNAPAISNDWGIAITPVGGTSAGVYSPDLPGMPTGAALPAWFVDGQWITLPPAGLPAGCKR